MTTEPTSTEHTSPEETSPDQMSLPQPSAPPPWEPPLSGSELEHLLGMLKRLRATFRWKADGLDSAGLNARIGASSLTIGGLLKHLAGVEATKFTQVAFGEDPGEPWRSVDWEADPDWDFNSAAHDRPEDLYRLYDEAVDRSRVRLGDAVGDAGLDQPIKLGDGEHQATLRRLVCDLIEEYGRHTGHCDLLREAVDGRVGEDPPWEWLPPWNR